MARRGSPGRSTAVPGTFETALPAPAVPCAGRGAAGADRRSHHRNEGLVQPDWSDRAKVRIAGPDPKVPAFFEAETTHEWVATLRFRVPRGTFTTKGLEGRLGLRPFEESAVPVLSNAARVHIGPHLGLHEVTITAHSASDLATPAFDAFLNEAIAAALGTRRGTRTRHGKLSAFRTGRLAGEGASEVVPPLNVKAGSGPLDRFARVVLGYHGCRPRLRRGAASRGGRDPRLEAQPERS